MATEIMPDDYWHTFVYDNFDSLACSDCEQEPALQWAWKGVEDGEFGVQQFTIRAVNRLRLSGWTLRDGFLRCQECSVKNSLN
jgi:hypothetical protein